jgi:hypothetical protein
VAEADVAEIAQLVRAQAAARRALTLQALEHARVSTRAFRRWYDHDAIRAWAEALAAQMEVYQTAVARNTDAFLARVIGQMLGVHRLRPIGAVDVRGLRGGVTHAGAYGRAANVYRWQQARFDAVGGELAAGRQPAPPVWAEPHEAAVQRVVEVADTDVQLAARAQEAAAMQAAAPRGVEGYRRVVHPELSRGGVCGLCVAASDRLYSTEQLRPIHARCECTVLPVVRGQDPGLRLNDLDLRRLYRAAGSTSAADLKTTRWEIGDHGELGPVLQARGQGKTAEQAARETKAPPQRSAEDIARIVQRKRDTLAAALPRARELAAADKQWGGYLSQLEQRIAQLEREAA